MKKRYKESVKVRWSDLDANMHLANQSYMSFTSFARMEALKEEGITLAQLHKWKRGPVIFEEKFSFFREIHAHSTVYIHTHLRGLSEDGVLFEFEHNLYDEKGDHKAKSTIFGCWLDFETRKMATTLPDEMMEILSRFQGDETRVLTRMDIKNLTERPQPIDPSEL